MPSALPSCSTLPAFMTAIRLARLNASFWSWVTKTNVPPISWCRRRNSSCIAWRSLRSSAASGSSSSNTFGLMIRARARATRCCWPPESAVTERSANSVRRDRRSASLTRSPISILGPLLQPQAVADVLAHRHVRKQPIALKHRVGRARSGPSLVTSRPSISIGAGRRRDEAADHAQKRGLAAAGRSENGDENHAGKYRDRVFRQR